MKQVVDSDGIGISFTTIDGQLIQLVNDGIFFLGFKQDGGLIPINLALKDNKLVALEEEPKFVFELAQLFDDEGKPIRFITADGVVKAVCTIVDDVRTILGLLPNGTLTLFTKEDEPLTLQAEKISEALSMKDDILFLSEDLEAQLDENPNFMDSLYDLKFPEDLDLLTNIPDTQDQYIDHSPFIPPETYCGSWPATANIPDIFMQESAHLQV